MSKKKLLFILVIEVFVFALGLIIFFIAINNDPEALEEKLPSISILLIVVGSIVYKITTKLYKDIEYTKINDITFEQDKSYFRDIIKKYSIAELSFIDGFKFDYFNDIIAMLLKLERINAIKIENEKIIVLDCSKLSLKESEKYLLNSIKNGYLHGLDSYELKEIVKKECIEDKLIESVPNNIDIEKEVGKIARFIGMIVFMPIIIVECIRLINALKPYDGFVVYILYFIIFAIGTFSIIFFVNFITSSAKNQVEFKLLEEGKDLYSKLNGLKNYIKDFSSLGDKKKEHIKLWDDYLIYSVMFGLNKQIPDKYLKIFKEKPDIPISEGSDKGIYFKH